MSSVKVRVSEFLDASRQRIEESARRSDALRGGELDRVLAELPADVRDRFISYQERTGATVFALTAFLDTYGDFASARARQADTDQDGFLSLEDAAKLPRSMQDLFHASLWSLARGQEHEREWDASPRDLTSDTQSAAQGLSRSGREYRQAKSRALRAIITRDDSPRSARALLRSELDQDALVETRLDRELKERLDAGTVELLSREAATALGEDPDSSWLFRVQLGGEGRVAKSPFYVSVDRQSGRAFVSAAA